MWGAGSGTNVCFVTSAMSILCFFKRYISQGMLIAKLLSPLSRDLTRISWMTCPPIELASKDTSRLAGEDTRAKCAGIDS
jgi:hypothetical protein